MKPPLQILEIVRSDCVAYRILEYLVNNKRKKINYTANIRKYIHSTLPSVDPCLTKLSKEGLVKGVYVNKRDRIWEITPQGIEVYSKMKVIVDLQRKVQ